MSDGNATPIVLWQMPPVWGLPNPSPFCMKVETWLRMAGLPYATKAIHGPPKSKSGKVPYIERPDGGLLWDSSAIIDTLTLEHGIVLDRHLSDDDRAIGTLLQRTLEEDLYFIALYDRWVDDHNWSLVSKGYFAHVPWLVRTLVVPIVRRSVIAAARGQGVSRLPEGRRAEKGKADLRAIARVLGDKPYFFGQPSSYDAMAYAFLANLLWAPLQTALGDELRAHPNLVAYCERMKAQYWAGWSAGA